MKTQTDQTADELSAGQLAKKWDCTLETIWRRCRRGLPHRRIKQQGRKPVLRFSWSECERWLDLMGFTGRSRKPEVETTPPPAELNGAPMPATQRGRLEAAELQAWQDYEKAESAGRPSAGRFRIWLQWCNALADDEKRRLKTGAARDEIRQRIQGEVLEHLALWGTPVREALDRMPAVLGAKCNPVDPMNATQALRDWVSQLVRLLDRPIFPEAHEIK